MRVSIVSTSSADHFFVVAPLASELGSFRTACRIIAHLHSAQQDRCRRRGAAPYARDGVDRSPAIVLIVDQLLRPARAKRGFVLRLAIPTRLRRSRGFRRLGGRHRTRPPTLDSTAPPWSKLHKPTCHRVHHGSYNIPNHRDAETRSCRTTH
jgi:hypothetical protein